MAFASLVAACGTGPQTPPPPTAAQRAAYEQKTRELFTTIASQRLNVTPDLESSFPSIVAEIVRVGYLQREGKGYAFTPAGMAASQKTDRGRSFELARATLDTIDGVTMTWDTVGATPVVAAVVTFHASAKPTGALGRAFAADRLLICREGLKDVPWTSSGYRQAGVAQLFENLTPANPIEFGCPDIPDSAEKK